MKIVASSIHGRAGLVDKLNYIICNGKLSCDLPYHTLLKVVDIPHPVGSTLELCYDPHWLMVTKATNRMFPNTSEHWVAPILEFRWVLSCAIHGKILVCRSTPEAIKELKAVFGGSFKV